MAFEPVFRCVILDNQRKLCSCQTVVEARLIVPGGNEIAKILSISPTCEVSLSEVFTGEARFSGKVNFKALYESKDGANCCLDYNAEFLDKINSDSIANGQRGILSAVILDTDIVSVSEKEIKLAAVVEISLDAVMTENANMLIDGGAGLYTHDDRLEYSKFCGEAEGEVAVTETLENVLGKKILLVEPKAVIDKREISIDAVIISGRVLCDLTIETDEGMIDSILSDSPFTLELPINGARRGDVVITSKKINSFSVAIEPKEKDSTIKLDFVVGGKASVFSEQVANPITDVFSIERELLKVGVSQNVYRNFSSMSFLGNVDGAVTLDVNMDALDNIMAITGKRLNVSRVSAGDGSVTVEGIVHSNIIYYCAEKNTKNSLEVELPFSQEFAAEFVTPSMTVTACGAIVSASGKIKRGNEIALKAEIEIEASVVDSAIKYIITELSEGEEIPPKTGAFSIHLVKEEETLWSVARALGSTPELILTQNPALELPLAGGERIICYRHLKKE